jgi:hypothetical protein
MPMYASIRSYRLDSGDMREVMHRVDTEFADRLVGEPGFVDYQCVDCGDNVLCTITIFHDQDGADRSVDMAMEFVRERLSDMTLERTDVKSGRVDVSRAASDVLEPAHA